MYYGDTDNSFEYMAKPVTIKQYNFVVPENYKL